MSKVLPGFYFNVYTNQPTAITPGDRGVVAMGIETDWGLPGEVVYIDATTNTKPIFGANSEEILPLKLALANAVGVLAYKLNDGTEATGQLVSGVTATAAQPGVLGNKISLVVKQKEETFEVQTKVDGSLVDTQVVAKASELVANDWVVFSGEGALTDATVTLAGGTNVAATADDHVAFRTAIENEFFQTVAVLTDDKTVIDGYVNWFKYQREEEDKGFQLVQSGVEADYWGVINVDSGGKYQDGTFVSKVQMCAWVAGATAGARVNQSLTGKTVQGFVDVVPRLSKKQQEEAINAGKFIMKVNAAGVVTCVYDINSYVNTSIDKNAYFKKNRFIRTIDGICVDLKAVIEAEYMGKIDNDKDGRSVVKGAILEYLTRLQEMRAIQNLVSEDVTVLEGPEKDSMDIKVAVQTVDSGEKFYFELIIN